MIDVDEKISNGSVVDDDEYDKPTAIGTIDNMDHDREENVNTTMDHPDDDTDDNSKVKVPRLLGWHRSTAIILISAISVTCLLSTNLIIYAIAKNLKATNIRAFSNVSMTRFCSFEECVNSKCSPLVAPYICLQSDDTDRANVGGWYVHFGFLKTNGAF
jgi:hypothetical protein